MRRQEAISRIIATITNNKYRLDYKLYFMIKDYLTLSMQNYHNIAPQKVDSIAKGIKNSLVISVDQFSSISFGYIVHLLLSMWSKKERALTVLSSRSIDNIADLPDIIFAQCHKHLPQYK